MDVTEAGSNRLESLRGRAGHACIGFLFQGSVGTCRGSSPILKPVSEPVVGACELRVGKVRLFALGDYAGILKDATFDYDNSLFGKGLTISWPHRGEGCPNCR